MMDRCLDGWMDEEKTSEISLGYAKPRLPVNIQTELSLELMTDGPGVQERSLEGTQRFGSY